MAQAAYSSLVTVATGVSIAYVAITGIKNVQFGESRTSLDRTNFAVGSNVRQRLLGLRDTQITISGDYVGTDTGWSRVRQGYLDGNAVVLQYWTQTGASSAGFYVACMVESFDITSAIDGLVTVSAKLAVDATTVAPATIP